MYFNVLWSLNDLLIPALSSVVLVGPLKRDVEEIELLFVAFEDVKQHLVNDVQVDLVPVEVAELFQLVQQNFVPPYLRIQIDKPR